MRILGALCLSTLLVGCVRDLHSGDPPAPTPPDLGAAPIDCIIAAGATPAAQLAVLSRCYGVTADVISQATGNDLDLLFVVDNSPSMSPKQRALAQSIPLFIQKLEDSGANYHIGVATSDVGTYVAPGQPWSISLGSCNSYEGDDGTLQRVACNTRTGVSTDAITACQTLCPDPKFVPEAGQGFISKVNGITNVPKEMVLGRDVGPQKAFQCMTLVGDAGCGIEGTIEGAKRALDGHNPMNKDFLRPGSVLAVVFITDEDDCSVALNRRSENDPVSMDCPMGNKDAPAACFNPDYRCIARDVICNEPLNTPGNKTNCQERDNSYLEKVDNYVRFFSALRPANKLLISGIWTLPRLDGGGKFVVSQRAGSTRTEGLNRGTDIDAGCINVMNSAFFGRPQLRLSKLARQFKDSIEVSICDTANYPAALDSVAAALKTKSGSSCLSAPPRLEVGKPQCIVGEVDARTPDAVPTAAFPQCGDGCCNAWANAAMPTATDPGIRAACAGETAQACYCAPLSRIGACAGSAVAGVWYRGGGSPAPDKVISFRCAKGSQ